jgi:hypothetical protein
MATSTILSELADALLPRTSGQDEQTIRRIVERATYVLSDSDRETVLRDILSRRSTY